MIVCSLESKVCNVPSYDKTATGPKTYFNRVATYYTCELETSCGPSDKGAVAEILDVTADGMTVVYTDSINGKIGFLDITDPKSPQAIGSTAVGGEPTSVSVVRGFAIAGVQAEDSTYTNPKGSVAVLDISSRQIVKTFDLGGQPDSVAVSPDGKYAAVAIENERDEDLGDGGLPQLPAGFVVVMDIDGDDVNNWSAVSVNITGLTGINYPEDPEPEYVSINSDNIAVVTLQENNGIVLIDCATKTVIGSFSAGSVDLTDIDIKEEKALITLDGTQSGRDREPDGVTWIDNDHFATANEGDWNGGSRGFTIFKKDGTVVYESGNWLDHITVQLGHYPDGRSGNKGNEPENVSYGKYGEDKLLFVNSERSSLALVFNINDPANPKFVQALPSSIGPEGSKAVPGRDLFLVATEVHEDGVGYGSVGIYHREAAYPTYPMLMSTCKDGLPIPWAALSGLGYKKGGKLYSVEDSFFKSSRIFEISVASYPYTITKAMHIMDTNDVFKNSTFSRGSTTGAIDNEFSADDLAKMINDDKSVNIDSEGIVATDDGFWVASEGRGTIDEESRPIESLNFIFKLNLEGVIEKVVTLPEAVNAKQVRYGFEGVTVDSAGCVVVAFQRKWQGDDHPRIGFYDPASEKWGFVFYPLETVSKGWAGLSDITHIGGTEFLVLERDNQLGLEAEIKKVFKIDVKDIDLFNTTAPVSAVTKTLFTDLLPMFKDYGGTVFEKVEGMAVDESGRIWINNDNDGIDDNSGENFLAMVPDVSVPTPTPTTSKSTKAHKVAKDTKMPKSKMPKSKMPKSKMPKDLKASKAPKRMF